jgi:ABC-type Fe3+/spermidine/putrescine transport system ATPase subunit
MTFILVTHDQEEALELSSQVAILNHGRLEQCGDPATLYNAPGSRFVAEFLGRSNFIHVDVSRGGAGLLHLQSGRHRFEHRQDNLPDAHAALLALRPERLVLTGGGDTSRPNKLPGIVSDISYRGADLSVSVTTDLGELIVRLTAGDGQAMPKAGDRVHVAWTAAAGYLLHHEVADGEGAGGAMAGRPKLAI